MGYDKCKRLLYTRHTVQCAVFHPATTEGWGPSVLFIYGPLLVGVAGIIFGFISQRWYLIALNVVPPLMFPATMLFGTLLFGP